MRLKPKYICSCSGGVDSVVLCHYLKSKGQLDSIFHFVYSDPQDFSLSALRIVNSLHQTLNVPIFVGEEDYDFDGNLEGNWRVQRYKKLAEVCKERRTMAAVGHHMDDQMTSYVLSKLKNSSRCFIPISAELYGAKVVRPFSMLRWNKEDIKKYSKENNLIYVEDPFNLVGDRSNVDLCLHRLKRIKQFKNIFSKTYEEWINKNYKNFWI